MNRTIQYAVHRWDGYVISRVGVEVAVPVLDYEKIGEGGDFRGPLQWNLEKMRVYDLASCWKEFRWTRYVPLPEKNAHRAFWGFKPLGTAPAGEVGRPIRSWLAHVTATGERSLLGGVRGWCSSPCEHRADAQALLEQAIAANGADYCRGRVEPSGLHPELLAHCGDDAGVLGGRCPGCGKRLTRRDAAAAARRNLDLYQCAPS